MPPENPRRLLALPRANNPVYLLIILAAVAFLYVPTLSQPFHGDDYVAFTQFKTKDLLTYSRDVFAFHDSDFYWRPLGKILHRTLYEGFGFDAFAFRATGLFVFLSTLVAIYAFCIRERFGALVALGATLIFGFLPNHVVSVAWVTNTSRLMAVLFFMLCLLMLQAADGRRRSYVYEAAAWLLFLVGALSDETALALAPIAVVYATFVRDERFRWKPALVRLVAFGILVAVLVPLQFAQNLDDEPRLAYYGFSLHTLPEAWTLASQLVLPITRPAPFDILIESIRPLQWAAGLAAICTGGLLMLVGTRKLRFLVFWTALGLAPFTLWDLSYMSPRYVYVAGVPYAIILSWTLVALGTRVREKAAELELSRRLAPKVFKRAELNQRLALGVCQGALAVGFALVLVVFGRSVQTRNQSWGNEAEKYGKLAQGLQRELPRMPKGSRIVIFDQDLPDFWATSVAQALSGDRTLRVMDIPPDRVNSPRPPFSSTDVIFYNSGGELVPSKLSTAR